MARLYRDGATVSSKKNVGHTNKKMPPCQNEAASWENRSSKGGVWHGGGGRPPRRRWPGWIWLWGEEACASLPIF